uniref:NADH-ubiquinone oxidoreductase chain 4 n=1 Tax=Habroteleia persimilis TaxID=2496286 RepID=A0A3Q8UA21_9HYME|nr:NADH dehydrogenase subunit 4 [Habroteleia persimilis]
MMGIMLFLIGMLLMMSILNNKLMLLFMQNLMFMLNFFMFMFLLNMKYINYWLFMYMDYGVDKMSLMMILLSLWILSLMYLSILSMLKIYLKLFIIQMLMLSFSLLMFFISMNLLSFYLFFEMSLIPIFLMILGWGNQPERLQAGVYMFLYTLFFSLPFLIFLINLYLNFNTLMLFMFMMNKFILFNNLFMYMVMLMLFLVKLPIYMVHLWLPKAHVEAPVFGSMILAGVMLKLGGYGVMRIIFLLIYMNLKYNLMLIMFMMISSIIVSMLCIRQIDLKMLIAYSSIVHMGFMMVGVMSLFISGMKGGFIMMISHGLCSSGMFCLLNFNYKRMNSRNLLLNKGLGQFFSIMMMWWFMFCVMNMSAPPSLNLVSEIFLIISMMKFSNYMYMLIFLMAFFSGIYSIFLYSYSQHGKNYFFNYMFMFNTIDEYLLILLHWIPLNLFILNLNLLN